MPRSRVSMALDTLGLTLLGRPGVRTMNQKEPKNTAGAPGAGLGLIPRLILAALALSPAFVPGAQAASCHVPSSAYSTIKAAVNDPTCATINVAAGSYAENVQINRSVTIRGDGQDTTIVDGTHTDRVFTITSGTVTIKGVTITNGVGSSSPFSGGGILIQGTTLSVENSTLSGNSADLGGGGIMNIGGTLSVSNSRFSENSGGGGSGGGISNNFGTLSVKNSTFSANSANNGGGITNSGTMGVSNSTFSGNSAGQRGGGIRNGGTLSVRNSTLSGNSAGFSGGGIDNSGAMTLTRVTFANNQPDDCAGICP